MRFFPVFLDLDHQPVLVVGGGEQAAQKIRLLAKTKARIRVLAQDPCDEIAGLAAAGAIALEPRPLAARDLAGVRLAYVALDDDAEAARAVAMARAAGVPVNAVDRQELCDFITPAIVDRDPRRRGDRHRGRPHRSWRGRSRRGSRRCCRRAWAGSPAGPRACASARPQRIARGCARRRFWDGFFDGPVARAYLAGDLEGAPTWSSASSPARRPSTGRVTLVGAGPGDPDLLTFKAMRALQEADVIVADRLVSPAILDRARRDARADHGRQDAGPAVAEPGRDQRHPAARGRGGHAMSCGSRAATRSCSAAAARSWRHCARPASPVEVVPGHHRRHGLRRRDRAAR